jgi:hypothetical protein
MLSRVPTLAFGQISGMSKLLRSRVRGFESHVFCPSVNRDRPERLGDAENANALGGYRGNVEQPPRSGGFGTRVQRVSVIEEQRSRNHAQSRLPSWM